MGCDNIQAGCDGHLECLQPGHTRGAWNEVDCFACIPHLLGADCTASATSGCGPGCVNCYDHPDDMLAHKQIVWRTGKRFLSPGKSILRGRDAHGMLSDLRTNVPLAVTRRMRYKRAPVWENDGTECFQTICESDFAKEQVASCTGIENQLKPGKHLDCFGYTQSGRPWPLQELNNGLDCHRLETDKEATTVEFNSGELCEPVNHRTHSCAANMLVLAMAKIEGSECSNSYTCYNEDPLVCDREGSQDDTPNNFRYYSETDVGIENRRAWETMHVENDASILHAPDESPEEYAGVDAKNHVLNALRQARFFGASPVNGENLHTLADRVLGSSNLNLGLWSRDLNSDNQPVERLPTAMPLTFRLRHSGGETVTGRLRIHSASIEAKLVVLPIGVPDTDGDPTDAYLHDWVPYVRVRIRAWTYIDMPTITHTLVREWKDENDPDREVEIVARSGPLPDGLPAVTPAGVDEVVCLDDRGVPFIPPRIIEWRGWLGEFSHPKTKSVSRQGSVGASQSNQLREALEGLDIPGWSDQHDGNPSHPVNVYGGKFIITRFTTT